MGKKKGLLKKAWNEAVTTAGIVSAVMATGSSDIAKQSQSTAKNMGTNASQTERSSRGNTSRQASADRNSRKSGKKRS